MNPSWNIQNKIIDSAISTTESEYWDANIVNFKLMLNQLNIPNSKKKKLSIRNRFWTVINRSRYICQI